MKIIRIILLLALIGGGLYLSYEYYFEEYGMYREAMNSSSTYYQDDYIYKFPEGRWIEEVKEHRLHNEFLEVARNKKISDIRWFRRDHPGSKYDQQLVTWYDSLWDREISHYEEISKSKGTDPASAKFFRQLMYYMKDNQKSNLFVRFKRDIDLKDFTDYSPKAQKLLDDDARNYKDPVISENIISLKENFEMGEADQLERIVDKGISNSLDNVFEQKIIYVDTWKDNFAEDYPDSPIIELNYHIRNSAFISRSQGVIYPDIWTYTIDEKFITYVLGINIDFDFDFHIPGSDQTYSFQTSANPGESLSNMTNVRDAYRIMTRVTFQNFAQEISDKFGLGETTIEEGLE